MIGNYDFSILSSILINNNVFQYFQDAQFKAGIAANLKQDSDLYEESIAQLSMSNAKMITEHSILRREYEQLRQQKVVTYDDFQRLLTNRTPTSKSKYSILHVERGKPFLL